MQGSWPSRKSLRLGTWDYSRPGAYFVTICTHHKVGYFAADDVREMITQWWSELEGKFDGLQIDEFIVMPNHFHGILWICSEEVGRDDCLSPSRSGVQKGIARSQMTLGEIVHWFKTMTTNAYIRGVQERGWRRYDRRLWQRGYYDRIIRNEKELRSIRLYIQSNQQKLPGI